jgi:predicted lipoprotein with Yx(FWY)xxD motif
MLLKRSFIVIVGLLMVVVMAACDSGTSSGSSSYGSSGSSNTAPSSAPTVADTNSASVMIKTATATVKGQTQTILTNADGKTLYYFTPDTATSVACTSGCISVWPPLLSTGSGTPASAGTLSGTLSTQTDANGSQVEYNGHPLYLFSGDTAAGQTKGQGILGKWFVATPDLSLQKGGSSGKYGY